jgi:hypothetical protein
MCSKNILIYNKEIGFIRIAEGDGGNLLSEDIENGYADYIMVDFIKFDGYEVEEIDGGQYLLNELYQEKFNSENEVIQYLINGDIIPDEKYIIL